jgi:hypothetical protein
MGAIAKAHIRAEAPPSNALWGGRAQRCYSLANAYVRLPFRRWGAVAGHSFGDCSGAASAT